METREDQVVRLCELTVTSHIIRGIRFEGCRILGPAVLAPLGETSLINCSFDGTKESLLWELPESREEVIGAIGAEDCEFIRCTFTAVGFAGPRAFITQFLAGTKS